mmetsp:Transcript_133836/g.373153  ORF Transcript_133836/g.373153 Transcript_133836/m.373153 type:complete len:504 (+) Transcript_133836:504-2015(+)
MLRSLLSVMGSSLLFLGLCQDELEHRDSIRALCALTRVRAVPRRRWFRLRGLHGNEAQDLRIVRLQDGDCLGEQGFGFDNVLDVLRVGQVFVGAVLGLSLLAGDVLLQLILALLDHGLQAVRRILYVPLYLTNLALERRDLTVLRAKVCVVRAPLALAPSKLIIVCFLLLVDEVGHVFDLGQYNRERVVGFKQGCNFDQTHRPLCPCRLLQGCLCLMPLRIVPRGAVVMFVDSSLLEECRGAALGGRDRAKRRKGGIAIEDRDGLCDSGLLARSEHGALLVLFSLRSAHTQQLLKECLGSYFGCLCGRQFVPLRGERAVVREKFCLLGLFLLEHNVVLFLHLSLVCEMSRLCRLLDARRALHVALEGVSHVLEDANHLGRLRGVGGRERSLQERLDRRGLALAHDCRGRNQRLLHGRLQPEQHCGVFRHVLRVVCASCRCLVRADVSKDRDGVVHFVDRTVQVRNQGIEVSLLLGTDLIGFRNSSYVGLHGFLQLSYLRAEDR